MSDLNSLIYKNLTTDHIDLSVKVNACFANDPKFYEQMRENQEAREAERLARKAKAEEAVSDKAEPSEQPEATKEAPDYDREAHKRFMRSFR